MSRTQLLFQYYVKGVPTDVDGTVLLRDAFNTYGVRRQDTLAVLAEAGTPMDHVGTGTYEHWVEDSAYNLTYQWNVEVTEGILPPRYYARTTPGIVSSPTSEPTLPATLVTVGELRKHLNLGPTDDPYIASLAGAVTDQWELATGRLWARRDGQVEMLRPEPYDRYTWLSLYPVERVTLREWDSSLGYDPAVVPDTELRVDKRVGRLELTRSSPWLDTVEAVVTGGYTAATLPPAVKFAIMVQVAFLHRRLQPEQANARGISINRGSIDFVADDAHPHFKALAEGARRLV